MNAQEWREQRQVFRAKLRSARLKLMISPLVSKVNPRVTPGSGPVWISVVVQFEFPQGWYSTPTCGKLVGMLKVGDLVTAQGYNGVFRVCSFSKDQTTAEIELFNVSQQQPIHYRMTFTTSV